MADTPFDKAHSAIWTALLAYQPFKDSVKVGNRIDLSENTGAPRRQIHRPGGIPNDAPEVEIDQGPWRESLRIGNSKDAGVVQTFLMYIESGQRTIQMLNAIKWYTFKALARAGDDLGLRGLVKSWDITQGTDNTTQDTSGRRVGFDAVATITVEMYVSRDSLLAD